jgi:hypothetical protein
MNYLSNDKKMEGSNIIKLPILKEPGEVIIKEIDYHELVNTLF